MTIAFDTDRHDSIVSTLAESGDPSDLSPLAPGDRDFLLTVEAHVAELDGPSAEEIERLATSAW